MKNQVFGKLNILGSVDVNNATENLALLEAGYHYNPNRMVAWELVGIDSRGNRHNVNVHEIEINMNEFVEV
jgi:hypothetical protein